MNRIIKRIVLILFLSSLVFNCGSRKSTARKRHSKTEHVVIGQKPIESPSITKGKSNTIEPAKITSTEQYLATYSAIAQQEMRLYKIPASITLAQGILESNSGRGRLSVEANNHFGIKCHDWTGAKVYHDDDTAQECFRKYNDAKYSYRDHSLFLTTRKRYANLFKLDIDDYKGWAKELKAAGYATDRKYPDKLITLIQRYKLYKLDDEVLDDKNKNYTNVSAVVENNDATDEIEIISPEKNTTVNVIKSPEKRDSADTMIVSSNKKEPSQVSTSNSYTVEQGDTLFSIGKKYNISIEKLQELNGLTNTEISLGQKLLVKSYYGSGRNSSQELQKKVEVATNTYIVEQGDTLYSISKKYNISLDDLQELNGLTDNTISLGQELRIKSLDEQERNNSQELKDNADVAVNNTYIVEQGDTLYSISKKYHTTVEALQALNNLNDTTVSIGQELIIK